MFEPLVPRRRTRREIAEHPDAPPLRAEPAPTQELAGSNEPQGALLGDPAACRARLREEAIRIAGSACARALGTAVARNPLFVARFVDEALRALGDPPGACIRVNPVIAPIVSGADRVVTSDESLKAGDVRVEYGGASVGATLEERASLLARAIADA